MLQGFNWESHRFEWYKLVQGAWGQIPRRVYPDLAAPCTDSPRPRATCPATCDRPRPSTVTSRTSLADRRASRQQRSLCWMQCSTTVARRTRASTASGTAGRAPAWTGASGRLPTQQGFHGRAASQPATSSGAHPTSTTSTPRCRRTSASGSSGSPTTSVRRHPIDFSKGYGGEFAGTTPARMPEFAVGEYWDTSTTVRAWSTTRTHRQRIIDWIDSTGGICTAFDYDQGYPPGACGRSEFWRLVDKKGRAPASSASGPDARSPSSTTTIPVPPSRIRRSPATRLAWATRTYTSRTLGHPVFWDHYFDWGDDLRNQIQGLMDTRKKAASTRGPSSRLPRRRTASTRRSSGASWR